VSDGAEVQADLERAAQALREKTGLDRRLAGAVAHAEQAEQRACELRDRLAEENAEVESLESFSFARIWAGLKGSRASDLERETAERDAARYAVADAEARAQVARSDVAGITEQLRVLGNVDGAYAAALAHKDAWVQQHDTVRTHELAGLAEQRGTLGAEVTETAEAEQAGLAARDLLVHARQLLGSAGSWATWDTFGGGGIFTDIAKYDKMNQAQRVLREVDMALGSFGRELADVGLTGVGAVEVDSLTRTFDVFFDNIFSDLAVRSRIQQATARVEDALRSLEQVLHTLQEKTAQLDAELRAIDDQRERLLLT
jgi:hypothetical protein